MAKADVDRYMRDHGMTQTNIYSMSVDRGRTSTCPYPLPGGSSLMLEMQCSRVGPGLFDWGHPVLSRAYIRKRQGGCTLCSAAAVRKMTG
jgi:hypothetical protein